MSVFFLLYCATARLPTVAATSPTAPGQRCVKVVVLPQDRAEQGLDDPVRPPEHADPPRSEDLLTLRVVVVGDVDAWGSVVEVVQIGDAVLVLRARQHLHLEGDVRRPLRHRVDDQPREGPVPSVRLAVRRNQQQHRLLGAAVVVQHVADPLRQRRGAPRRAGQRLREGRVVDAADVGQLRAVQEVDVDAVVVQAARDLAHETQRLPQLVPPCGPRLPQPALARRHAAERHAARVVSDDDHLVFLQHHQVVGIGDGDLVLGQDVVQDRDVVAWGGCVRVHRRRTLLVVAGADVGRHRRRARGRSVTHCSCGQQA
eukprot:Rhum_TRINITY_DN15550_c0_g1::Rhum_TRINITY_DN15550_c0_g1_i1::g.161199::m.161199